MLDFDHAFARVDYRLELADRTEDQKLAFLAGLEAVCSADTPRLNELCDWLRSLLDSERDECAESKIEVPVRRDREVVDRHKSQDGCYQLEKIRCGKSNCKCANGNLHGPYWYHYQKRKGKVVSRYLGKKQPNNLNKTTQDPELEA